MNYELNLHKSQLCKNGFFWLLASYTSSDSQKTELWERLVSRATRHSILIRRCCSSAAHPVSAKKLGRITGDFPSPPVLSFTYWSYVLILFWSLGENKELRREAVVGSSQLIDLAQHSLRMASQHDPIIIYNLGISWDHLPLSQPNHAFDGHCHVLLSWFASKMSQRTASGLHRQSLQRCYQNLFEEVRSWKWHGHINHVSNMSAWECQTSKAQRLKKE